MIREGSELVGNRSGSRIGKFRGVAGSGSSSKLSAV